MAKAARAMRREGGGRRILRALLAFICLWAAALEAEAAEPRWLGTAPSGTPRRVVTLAPSLTEIVLDLGKGDLLVGVSRYDDAAEVRHLRRVGGFLDPVPEAILALRPDLVLAQPSPGNQGAVERLASLGIPVLVLPLHTVEEILASVRAVGAALGDEAGGRALAARIEAGISEVRERTASLPRKRTLIVYGWKPLVVAGPASFAHELLLAAGGENVAAEASGAYPTFPAEAVLAAKPEAIVDASGGHGDGLPAPGIGPVHTLRSQGLFHPGPRLLEGLRELAALLHPERFAAKEPVR